MAGHPVLLSHSLGSAVLQQLTDTFPETAFVLLPSDGTVPANAVNARALLRQSMPHDALHRALDGAPHLEWIHTASAGFNWVLTPRVAATEILLTRTANVLDKPIAEFVVTLALALNKQLPMFLQHQTRREWQRPDKLGTLIGRTAGIVGAGAIGRETASRLKALGMRVLGTKRTPEPLPEFDEVLSADRLPDLLKQVDLLVIACPLTPETKHLIGHAEFAQMKPEAILINIARGAILVEEDLIKALQEGVIAAAGLDVFDVEPLPVDNPLWDLPNVIITPHVSYLSIESDEAMLKEFSKNLRRFLAGEPLQNSLKSKELGY